jgi:DNA-binding MarR family transcriptional regulator
MSAAPREPAAIPGPADPAALYAAGSLATAVRRLAERLEEAMRRLHAGDDLTVAERSLLLALRQAGLQTVPQLAARRGSTRQYVQQALAPLVERGLVQWQENPRHRRSRLAGLSTEGLALARRVMAREGLLMRGVAAGLPRGEALAASAALAELERVLAPALATALAGDGGEPPEGAGKAMAARG